MLELRVLTIVLLAVGVRLVATVAAPNALATSAEELHVRTSNIYEVRTDGRVHVTVEAQVVNRDSTTVRRSSGTVYFYTGATFVVHDGAANLIARSGSIRLATEVRDRNELARLISIRFGRELYFNETISIIIEYDLISARTESMIIVADYAFIPAIVQGNKSILEVRAGDGRTALMIDAKNCGSPFPDFGLTGSATYYCGSSERAADYQFGARCGPVVLAISPATNTVSSAQGNRWNCAYSARTLDAFYFESTSKTPLTTRESQVKTQQTTIRVLIRHFSGEDEWAAKIESLAVRGMPALEEAHGFPYRGPGTIEIVESGYRDTHGYEGSASAQGRVRLTPLATDQTALHELAHYWSDQFKPRWLAEGMADYTANLVATKLGLKPDELPLAIPLEPRLTDWQPPRLNPLAGIVSGGGSSGIDRERERAGYVRSLKFMELLAEQVGPEGIAAANSRLAKDRIPGTARSYLDSLEDTSQKDVASLFGQWVLDSPDVSLLLGTGCQRR